MTVVIHTDSYYALTAPSMTRMTSVTQILLVNSVSNLVVAFSLTCNRQYDIKLFDPQSTRFGVYNYCMTHMTLAHALMNYHVSQFGH